MLAYMRHTLFALLLLCTQAGRAQGDAQKLEEVIRYFERGYYALNVPGLVLDFRQNLNAELATQNLAEQQAFFEELTQKLSTIDSASLSSDNVVDFTILSFEARLNMQRLELISKTAKNADIDDLERIYGFENGPEWYAWYIKKWTGSEQSPEAIMAFGKEEVKRIKKAIKALDLPEEKPAEFYTRDVNQIKQLLRAKSDLINTALKTLMPDFAELPDLAIERGRNAALAQAPGYYNNNTFYFNLFDKPFDLADCDWLLIHEGNPGHHFQRNYHANQGRKSYRKGLRNLGFIEGWAAYTENLGWEMGLYQNPFEALGKWNWDLIRSVRVVLDVAINYQGWTDEQCMNYWQEHINGQDDIARREIARMKRWPAQVLTYKLGEAKIREALATEKQRLGETFSFKDFHTHILANGPVPGSLTGFVLR